MKDRINRYEIAIMGCVTIIVLSLVIIEKAFFEQHYLLSIALPWLSAESVGSITAIEYFGTGEIPGEIYLLSRGMAITALIVFFYCLPVLFLWSSDKRNQEMEPNTNNNIQLYGYSWYLATSLIVTLIIITAYLTVDNILEYSENRNITERLRESDKINQELLLMGMKVAEFQILPAEYGGGEGSFVVRSDDDIRHFSLDDISKIDIESSATYTKEILEDGAVMKITGISEITGRDPEFLNANRDTGKVEISFLVEYPAVWSFDNQN